MIASESFLLSTFSQTLRKYHDALKPIALGIRQLNPVKRTARISLNFGHAVSKPRSVGVNEGKQHNLILGHKSIPYQGLTGTRE